MPSKLKRTNTSGGSNSSNSNQLNRSKRSKRSESLKYSGSDLESVLKDCNMKDAKEIESKLRKVATKNGFTDDEMRKLLEKFVKNEHVLALVTLKAEDELEREKHVAEKHALVITETTSVPKLTRAKARELNRTPGITLPPFNDSSKQNEIKTLIHDELLPDDDDEEYTFKEDDFVSDDDHNTTASEMDSNPCTPQTPLTAAEESPLKLTADGCFKIPLNKNKDEEDLRIATRTRSKLCLQETTIEAIQSEFVPPDVEQNDVTDLESAAVDEDWMQFLNDFTKPLNNSFTCDDDDPINDPEYVVAEMVPIDAEELRDVNISKKELTDLVSELFEGLLKEGVSLESIDLETPQKFLQTINDYNQVVELPEKENEITNAQAAREQVKRQIDFELQSTNVQATEVDAPNITQHESIFQPNVMSTPSTTMAVDMNVAIAEPVSASSGLITVPTTVLKIEPELIAIPVPGQQNCYQLVKLLANADDATFPTESLPATATFVDETDTRYTVPYDSNFTWRYISVRNHVYSDYLDKFENLRFLKPDLSASKGKEQRMDFTVEQHFILQQQLRIHVQMLTQTFLQTYSSPKLYKMAAKPKEMLHELKQKAETNASFNSWNLNAAVELITKWEADLNSDEYKEENAEMMDFIYQEIELTEKNSRQVVRLPPRIMQTILNSTVFMYPQYLPRMAFSSKERQVSAFAPSEYQLIAMGLEKHMKKIRETQEHIHKRTCHLRLACKLMAKDTVHGKLGRRLFEKVGELRKDKNYNPIKYYFEHGQAPPVEQQLITFKDGTVLPLRERYDELPSGWKYYMDNKSWTKGRRPNREKKLKASANASTSYKQFVREAIGEDITFLDSIAAASDPDGSPTDLSINVSKKKSTNNKSKSVKTPHKSPVNSLTFNVNYIFGNTPVNQENYANELTGVRLPSIPKAYNECVDLINRSLTPVCESNVLQLPPTPPPIESDTPVANFSYDFKTQSLQPIVEHNVKQQTESDIISGPGVKRKTLVKVIKPKFCIRKKGFAALFKNCLFKRYVLHNKTNLRRYCQILIQRCHKYLNGREARYAHVQPVQYYFKKFHALDLYTRFLLDLKMFCRNKNGTATATTTNKRQRSSGDDEMVAPPTTRRRTNRQEENFRHMLQPDTPEEADRKDETFASNFYDKVEEAFRASNRVNDFKKFTQLLRNFNPRTDKVINLYAQIEQLLLPENEDLAEVFLSFLLPAEAAQIGKFFEHFMITNATTFINKLNIYFNKQPAQIRKIYACLNELAEKPNITMKQVEAKILPLLRGNQFLIDWFLQQFPNAKPPERILPPPEIININEVGNNQTGEYMETVVIDSTTQEQQQQSGCQLKYINGRIFYGSKILLPAKLAFMANNVHQEQIARAVNPQNDSKQDKTYNDCAHGMRTHGDHLINSAIAAESAAECNSDNEEETDKLTTVLIDVASDEDTSSSVIELCDEPTQRVHAMRLNPGYYSNYNSVTANNGATTTAGIHVKKIHSLTNEDNRLSPRKNATTNTITTSGVSITTTTIAAVGTMNSQVNACATLSTNNQTTVIRHDKRKSPTKKGRSPNCNTNKQAIAATSRINTHPMVVIHEHSNLPAIACAKRLRTLIEEENATQDFKASINIIARAKYETESSNRSNNLSKSAENDSLHNTQLMSSDTVIPVTECSFTPIKIDKESSGEEDYQFMQPATAVVTATAPILKTENVISTQFDSDEDCKLDIVATLANSPSNSKCTNISVKSSITSASTTATIAADRPTVSKQTVWTRDEDKTILVEMKLGSQNLEALLQRISLKLPQRSMPEIIGRHQFLMEFLSKLQGKYN